MPRRLPEVLPMSDFLGLCAIAILVLATLITPYLLIRWAQAMDRHKIRGL